MLLIFCFLLIAHSSCVLLCNDLDLYIPQSGTPQVLSPWEVSTFGACGGNGILASLSKPHFHWLTSAPHRRSLWPRKTRAVLFCKRVRSAFRWGDNSQLRPQIMLLAGCTGPCQQTQRTTYSWTPLAPGVCNTKSLTIGSSTWLDLPEKTALLPSRNLSTVSLWLVTRFLQPSGLKHRVHMTRMQRRAGILP